jgi:hypothetical protein
MISFYGVDSEINLNQHGEDGRSGNPRQNPSEGYYLVGHKLRLIVESRLIRAVGLSLKLLRFDGVLNVFHAERNTESVATFDVKNVIISDFSHQKKSIFVFLETCYLLIAKNARHIILHVVWRRYVGGLVHCWRRAIISEGWGKRDRIGNKYELTSNLNVVSRSLSLINQGEIYLSRLIAIPSITDFKVVHLDVHIGSQARYLGVLCNIGLLSINPVCLILQISKVTINRKGRYDGQ